MQDEELTPPADENLPDEAACDPSGPPEAVEAKDPVLNTIAGLGVALVALGGLMVPLFASTRHTAGATRSAKIQWEQRQQQIEQAVREEPGARAAAVAPPTDKDQPHDGDGV